MSRKPNFANLRTASASPQSSPPPPAAPAVGARTASLTARESPVPARPESRIGRKQIAGFFTPEMSFAMHMLARRQGRSLQALMAEAFNDVLRKHGESPIGE
jgi:hypothetical protein